MSRYVNLIAASAVFGMSVLAADAAAAAEAKFNQSQLVGAWELISAGNPNPNIKAFGPGDGYLVFQPNGRFSLQLALSDLPKFASNNRATGTADENKAVVQGSIAYFDLKRPINSLTADELKYTNPAASVGGATELAWKRVK